MSERGDKMSDISRTNSASKRIRSITDLIEYLKRDIPGQEPCWFRGHGNEKWKLVPCLARKKSWLSAEFDLIAKFKQNSALLISPLPETEWDWLTIMQHHGIPTRLLDWTESPLVGLYFAVCEKPRSDGALWALLPRKLNILSNITPDYEKYIPTFEDTYLNSYTPNAVKSEKTSRMKPVAVIGPRNTARMQSQQGTFTVIHRDNTPLEAIQGDHVIKYIIPKENKRKLFKELSLVRIGKFQLFPELQSIGEILKGGLT